jgi:hypothetical protein
MRPKMRPTPGRAPSGRSIGEFARRLAPECPGSGRTPTAGSCTRRRLSPRLSEATTLNCQGTTGARGRPRDDVRFRSVGRKRAFSVRRSRLRRPVGMVADLFYRSGFKVQGSGFRVQGSGFRVQGSGFRVQGSLRLALLAAIRLALLAAIRLALLAHARHARQGEQGSPQAGIGSGSCRRLTWRETTRFRLGARVCYLPEAEGALCYLRRAERSREAASAMQKPLARRDFLSAEEAKLRLEKRCVTYARIFSRVLLMIFRRRKSGGFCRVGEGFLPASEMRCGATIFENCVH